MASKFLCRPDCVGRQRRDRSRPPLPDIRLWCRSVRGETTPRPQTDADLWPLEPHADGFRNYVAREAADRTEARLVDKAIFWLTATDDAGWRNGLGRDAARGTLVS